MKARLFNDDPAHFDLMGAAIVAMTLIASATLVGLILLGLPSNSEAYLVHEVTPGQLQIQGFQKGSLIIDNIYVDHRRRWAYLEVQETRPMSGAMTSQKHFFYFPYRQAKFKPNERFLWLRYGLTKRVQNSRGRVPFGQKRYFYPLLLFKSVS